MFVVRVQEAGEEPDYKVFDTLVRAEAYFDPYFNRTFFDEEFESVTMFEVP